MSTANHPPQLSAQVGGGATPELDPMHVVGVGASAGGLEALEQLFGAMPEETGMAFVVVQHLSPDFRSVMDELLGRRTKIPVLLVENGMRVRRDCIYLIPPRKEMIISGGCLLLSDKGASQELTLPVDIFFRSLAQDVGDRAIGIVLSGAGSDGARGIRDIHAAGGLVLCQDEASANFDGMPRNARDSGVVDHVLPPAEMPTVLVEHARAAKSELAEALAPASAAPRPYGVATALGFLQTKFGIDFSHYKASTVVRRIERRLQLSHSASLPEYVERLSNDSEELDALFRDLLIGVTRFFRDEEAFRLLERTLIPELLDATSGQDEFRVWVAGCATGEEAYSLAILLKEELRRRKDSRSIKILATDVHRGSLEFASRGLYDADRVGEVPRALLERYFKAQGPSFEVSAELRQVIVFAPHNVIRDAPFTRIDLVSCRNLLIYLQPLAQKKVMSLLHFALKRHGILLLGPSETVGPLGDDFETVDNHWRVYRKHRDVRLPIDSYLPQPRSRALHSSPGEPSSSQAYTISQIVHVYDALLDEHMPPSLLVNERRELVHSFAGASRYLRRKDGRPSADLLDMLAPDLRTAVTGALQRVFKERAAIAYSGLALRVEDGEQPHRLIVKPIVMAGAAPNHVLITIEPIGEPVLNVPVQNEIDAKDLSDDHLSSLEAELRRTKEILQATVEELETSNEELQAANEELLASNEELQSTNEELQSVNEELYTVNAEYQKKIAELTQLTNDMDNLLASIQVGTIFLDAELRIRKFTPLIASAFNLLPQDVGRPIASFTHTLSHETMMADLETVLRSGEPIEREILDRSGQWLFLRILPYRARGAVNGVVLTLIDIGALKAAEDAVFRERYLLNSLMDSVPDAIYFKDLDERFVRVNRAMAERLGVASANEAAGKPASALLRDPEHRAFEVMDRRALAGLAQRSQEELQTLRDGRSAWFTTTRQPLRDRSGAIVGMLGVARDISEHKRATEESRMAVKRRDEFLAMLSHELRNPLSAVVNAGVLLRQAASPAVHAKSLDVIERQARQMTRLLDDLLEVGRITQNKIDLRRQVIDASAVVQEAVTAMRDKFSTCGVRLQVELDEPPVRVDADPARLQQVIVNLLDNAAKYTDRGGRAAVRLRREGNMAVLSVTDDGAGIDPALLPDLFEPFVQGGSTLDRTAGGMGLGLSVVRSLIEMHGGSVDVQSDGPSRGSCFTVRLPLCAAAPVAPSRRARLPWPEGKRVAVIEDNLDGSQMLSLLLEHAGYEVVTAHDGEQGFTLIEQTSPDIVIVDIGLPVMDGLELARRVRLRPQYANLYMVALTGYGQQADRDAALDAGFDAHVVKPLDLDELTRLMRADRR